MTAAAATPVSRGDALRAAVQPVLPGLGVAVAVAVAARLIVGLLPAGIGEVAVAVLLGLAAGAVLPGTLRLAPGLRVATTRVLRLGIVLLGARLSLDAVIAVGLPVVMLAAILVPTAVLLGVVLGRAAGLPAPLALLIGVGTGICGNSAILATAPVIDAEERHVSVAVATITTFGLLAVLVLPVVGAALGMTDAVYGRWAGLAVHDTSQVVAAGLARSDAAGDVAVVVKLVRNLALAPVLVAVAWAWPRIADSGSGAHTGQPRLRSAVPLFVVGFSIMVGIASAGLLDGAVGGRTLADWLSQAGLVLILVAVAAIGLGTRPATLLKSGPRALLVGLACAGLVATLAFVLVVLGGTPAPM